MFVSEESHAHVGRNPPDPIRIHSAAAIRIVSERNTHHTCGEPHTHFGSIDSSCARVLMRLVSWAQRKEAAQTPPITLYTTSSFFQATTQHPSQIHPPSTARIFEHACERVAMQGEPICTLNLSICRVNPTAARKCVSGLDVCMRICERVYVSVSVCVCVCVCPKHIARDRIVAARYAFTFVFIVHYARASMACGRIGAIAYDDDDLYNALMAGTPTHTHTHSHTSIHTHTQTAIHRHLRRRL